MTSPRQIAQWRASIRGKWPIYRLFVRCYGPRSARACKTRADIRGLIVAIDRKHRQKGQ